MPESNENESSIQEPSKRTSPLVYFVSRSTHALPFLILVAGWLLSGWIFLALKHKSEELDEKNFSDLVSEAEDAVMYRLRVYTDALQASAAYYLNSETMTRDEWRHYVEYVDISERYPGINGLGFIMPFTDKTLPAYVEHVRANESSDFAVKQVPNVERPPSDEMGFSHYIITHIEPIGVNRQALGLDTASEGNRQAAGRYSRDTGKAAMTGRITLVQDGKARPGFLIYMPMFTIGMPVDTVAERREAFIGWSYAPFVTELFLDGVLGGRVNKINFEIYDDDVITPETFVYGTESGTKTIADREFDHKSKLDLAGQTFSIGWMRGEDFQEQDKSSALIAGISLAVGTVLLSGIVLSLQYINRGAAVIVASKTEKLQKTNDQLKQKNEELKEFSYRMSHDIKAPVSSALGLIDITKVSLENKDYDTVGVCLDHIEQAMSRMENLVIDIVNLLRISSEYSEPEQINLRALVDDILAKLKHLPNAERILVTNEIDESHSVLVRRELLQQSLQNLISNAYKYTDLKKSDSQINISSKFVKNTCQISVKDNGIGVPLGYESKLFNMFSRLHPEISEGTGLGLYLVQKNCLQMGGSANYQPSGGDTEFVISIPNIATPLS